MEKESYAENVVWYVCTLFKDGCMERYVIIYNWKIIESIIPDLSKPIEVTTSERRGRFMCCFSCWFIGPLGTLLYRSFRLFK